MKAAGQSSPSPFNSFISFHSRSLRMSEMMKWIELTGIGALCVLRKEKLMEWMIMNGINFDWTMKQSSHPANPQLNSQSINPFTRRLIDGVDCCGAAMESNKLSFFFFLFGGLVAVAPPMAPPKRESRKKKERLDWWNGGQLVLIHSSFIFFHSFSFLLSITKWVNERKEKKNNSNSLMCGLRGGALLRSHTSFTNSFSFICSLRCLWLVRQLKEEWITNKINEKTKED